MHDPSTSNNSNEHHRPWRYEIPSVLVLLKESPARRDDLISQLPGMLPASCVPVHHLEIYELLRKLKDDGIVAASSGREPTAPSQEVYSLD